MSPSNRPLREWIVLGISILLAFSFAAAGLFKLIFLSAAIEQFQRFGYASWFVPVTVMVELVTAVMVLFPRTRYWGASLMIVTMIAAMLSHLKANEPEEMVSPLVLLLLALVVTWFGTSEEEPGESSEEGEAPALTWTLAVKQVLGTALVILGVYIGFICIFGREPLLQQYALLRWTGMLLGFGIAMAGIGMFNAGARSDDSSPHAAA